MPDSESVPETAAGETWKRWVLLGVVAALAVAIFINFRETLTLENLAQREGDLRRYQREHPVLVYGVAFAIYVTVAGLSLPGAAALSLLYGWSFGWVPGVVLVSFASTTGATLAFLLSRFLFRDAVRRRFGDRLANFQHALEQEGAFFLFMLRLIPAVPFFVINAVMGLTPLRTRTFWWVSQVGMLPGTIVYLYAGSSVPSLTSLAEEGINAALSPAQLTRIFIAFTLLGIFPLAVRWTLRIVTRGGRMAPSDRGTFSEDAGREPS